MTHDLLDGLTVALIITIFSSLFSPALVWLLTAQPQPLDRTHS